MRMRCGHRFELVIDVENYLDLITRNIRELDETSRTRVVKELRDQYNVDLNAKIDAAKDYVKIDIEPKIEKLFSALDIEMRKIVNETIALQANTINGIKLKQENGKIIRTNVMI